MEHIVQLNNSKREALAKWLQLPNGAHPSERVTFEAVEGGGILVRTKPYSATPEDDLIYQAFDRIIDLLDDPDGQSCKEARKFLERNDTRPPKQPPAE